MTMPKKTRDDVGYVYRSSNLRERCAVCVSQTATYECAKVVGNLNPLGWCRLFESKLPLVGEIAAGLPAENGPRPMSEHVTDWLEGKTD